MSNNNHFTILGWMLNECELSGNELLCYAYIYGLTQDHSVFCGTTETISEYIGISKETARKIISGLVDKNLLLKQEHLFNGKKISTLTTKTKKLAKIEEKLNAPYTGIYTDSYNNNNNNNNNISTIQDNQSIKEKESDKSLSKKVGKDELFEECYKAYLRKGSKKEAKAKWDKLNDEDRQKVKVHIPYYVNACSERHFQKDFVRYIKDRIFEVPVYNNNQLVYDPENGSTSVYHPYGNTSIIWDDIHKRYIIMSPPEWGVADGYTDDNRPSGAELWYQSQRYVWNEEKRWTKQ